MNTTTTARAFDHLASIDAHASWPASLFHPHMRDGHEATDWARLRAEMAAYVDAPTDPEWHGPGKLARLLDVYPRFGSLVEQVITGYVAERAAAARKAYLESTVEIQVFRGAKLGKPERLDKSKVDQWIKPGHVVIERDPNVTLPEDRGGDEMTFGRATLRTAKIGVDWPEGTVRAKRLITRNDRVAVQYLVKPRSKAAEKLYQMRRRHADLKAQLGTHIVDQMSADQIRAARAELAEIEAKLASL